MLTEPCQLISEAIDKLETISAYFADEVDESGPQYGATAGGGVGREGSIADDQDP